MTFKDATDLDITFDNIKNYYVTFKAACKWLNICESTFKNWRRHNKIPFVYEFKIHYMSKGVFKVSPEALESVTD